MLHTTFALLREAGAGVWKDSPYTVFRRAAQTRGYTEETQPIPLTEALESNDLDDTLWALRAVLPSERMERDKVARLFAADCADRVLPLYEARVPGDPRPRQAVNVARRYALGEATAEELVAAGAAAGAAARAAAWAAAGAAARAAGRHAARVAAWGAARAAARAAGRGAAWGAAWDAAGDALGAATGAVGRAATWATWSVGRAARRADQAALLRSWLEEPERLEAEVRASLSVAEEA